jgi:hypothetical protein
MATPNQKTSSRRWSENPTNSTMDLHPTFVGVMELSMDEEAAGLASVASRARTSPGFLASAISPSLARNKVSRTLHDQAK